MLLDPVGERAARPVNTASSRSRSVTDPATSPAITGGSARTTGICETPYSRRISTASRDGLGRVGVHQGGQVAALAAQHLADGGPAVGRGRKP